MENIQKRIEESPYNLIFNTKPFVIEVVNRNIWPYTHAEIIEYERMSFYERLERFRIREMGREENEEENEKEEQIINAELTFKSDECVICLTNPPNVLFCNCGHIAICIECDEIKSLNICPICKTENKIKRTI